MNGLEKSHVDMPYTPESQYPVLSIHEWSETQLCAPSLRETSYQSVGFHSVSDGCGISRGSCVFYNLDGFGVIRSTQPTGRYGFSKKVLNMATRKPTVLVPVLTAQPTPLPAPPPGSVSAAMAALTLRALLTSLRAVPAAAKIVMCVKMAIVCISVSWVKIVTLRAMRGCAWRIVVIM